MRALAAVTRRIPRTSYVVDLMIDFVRRDALHADILQLLALALALDVDQSRMLLQHRAGDGAIVAARGKRVHRDVDRVGGLRKLILGLPRPPAPDQRFVGIRHATSPPVRPEPITRSVEEKTV